MAASGKPSGSLRRKWLHPLGLTTRIGNQDDLELATLLSVPEFQYPPSFVNSHRTGVNSHRTGVNSHRADDSLRFESGDGRY